MLTMGSLLSEMAKQGISTKKQYQFRKIITQSLHLVDSSLFPQGLGFYLNTEMKGAIDMKQNINRNRTRTISVFLSAIMLLYIMAGSFAAAESIGGTINYIANEDLAPGIHYSEEDHVNYGGVTIGNTVIAPHRVRFNHLSIDLSTDGVRISSTRADDTINARESIPQMAARATAQGNNVVAAINADPYDMDFGINCGIQVQNGNIIICEPSIGYTTNSAPAFYINSSGAHIDTLRTVFDVTVNNNQSFAVTSFNRNSFGSWYTDPLKITSDTLRIFTSNITLNHKMTHYREDTNPLPANHSFSLIRLDDFSGAVHAGTQYTGTVTQMYEDEGFLIPDDCVVLAGYAGDADKVRALKAGDSISFCGNLYTGSYSTDEQGHIANRGDLDNSVTAAVNGYHLLAKNGVINSDMVENQGTDINARTVIGITTKGGLEIICANKPGWPGFNASLSTGTNFKEITDYMVNDLGCSDVLNMDGGGSTEMVARRAGSDRLTTVSYPSDGTSRIVSNSLLIISDASRTADVGQVVVDRDINIYQGSTYQFSYRLTDKSGSSMSTAGQQVTWKAELGTIDQSGKYTAPSQPGADTITATVNGIAGTAAAQVVDSSVISSIKLSDSGTIAVKQGDKHQFGFNAQNGTGGNIVIDPALAEWSLTGDAGTLDKSGLLDVTASTGEGTVSCSFLGVDYSVPLVIGLDEQIIDDFEGGPQRADAYEISSKYIYPKHSTYWGGDGLNMVGVETDKAKVKSGSQSLYFIYDIKDWTRATNGTLSMYPFWDKTSTGYGQGTDPQGETWTEADRIQLQESYTAKAMPKKFGLWVYSGDENGDGVSDNYDCMSTCYFKTACTGPGTGISTSIKITPTEHMDWIGWKYLEFNVPQDWPMPITFNYLMVSNINKAFPVSKNYSTAILFDDLKYIYTDDVQDNVGPVFSNTVPAAGGIYKTSFDFSTVIADAANKVDPGAVTVTVNGEPFTDFTFDRDSGLLKFTESGLTDGETLRVIVKAKDTLGNDSVPYIDNTYTIDLSEDKEAPVISKVTPTNSSVVRIPSPRIGFQLQDAKIGVDPSSIAVELDGKKIKAYYDSDSGWGYAQPDFTLNSGSYPLTIDVSDKVGNAMTTYTDTLNLNPIPQPADPDNFSVSIMPDSQGNAYSSEIYNRVVAQNTDFIIHTGDIVDGIDESEYISGKQFLDGTGKPYLTIPGNHEGGAMNLNYYQKYFGSPTYTFDYGHTRFIGLNSAYNQSISATDPSEYPYLQQMLDNNDKSNIVIYSHVITRDPYYTEHNMTDAEATRFEGILSAYKASHPAVNITVLFGHLHTLTSWQTGGVNYIIDGNAAGKGYVTQDQGNFLGNGILKVKNGILRYKYEPIPSSVYLKHPAMNSSSLTAMQGASLQLDLYGDFHDPSPVANSSINYLTQLNDDTMVDIQWSSSDTNVASVSDTGVVTVNGAGQAKITAVCGGKTTSVTVNAVSQNNLSARDLTLSLPASTEVGRILVPSAVATDPYGSKIVLKLTGSMLTVNPKGILTVNTDGKLTAMQAGAAVVTVNAGGKTADASITVQAPIYSGGDSTSTPIISPIKNPTANPVTNSNNNVTAEVSGQIDASGSKASAALSSQDVRNLLGEADKNAGVKAVVITVKSSSSAKDIKLSIPASGFKDLSSKTDADIKVNTGIGSVSFSTKAVESIAGNITNGNVQIGISRADTTTLADNVKAIIGDNSVYSLSVASGDKNITTFGGGTVTVSLPYKLSTGEDPDKIIIYYISPSGTLVTVPNCKYDTETGTVIFTTTHFSSYTISHNNVSFSDVSGWYQNYVDFLAARKIINGTGGGRFSPDANITRAQFATILASLSGADLSTYTSSSFTDVSKNDWYFGAVQWAYANGIATGSKGMFTPNTAITRQEIAVMIARFAEKAGYSLLKINSAKAFTDSSAISSYATGAVTAMQQAGILSGNNSGSFAPMTNATRAEAAKMVTLLIQKSID